MAKFVLSVSKGDVREAAEAISCAWTKKFKERLRKMVRLYKANEGAELGLRNLPAEMTGRLFPSSGPWEQVLKCFT